MKQENEKHDASLPSDADIVELYWQRKEEAIRYTDEKYGKFLIMNGER